MNGSGAWLEGYDIARTSLREAIKALQQLSVDGFIVVGAQAVYLRTANVQVPMPPFTLDGDIVADPRWVRKPRDIWESMMRAGYVIRSYKGLYELAAAPPEQKRATEIDVFVPARFENDFDLQDYNRNDAEAVMSQAGLELTLVDHSKMEIDSVTVKVAGTVALLVAKGWKLGERYAKGMGEFRKVGKDVLDVYRLLRAVTPQELVPSVTRIPREARFKETLHAGTRYLRDLCAVNGPGLDLLFARDMLGDNEEARFIAESLTGLVKEFCDIVAANG